MMNLTMSQCPAKLPTPRLKILFNLPDEQFSQIVADNVSRISLSSKVKNLIKERVVYHESPPLYMRFYNLSTKTKVAKVDHHLDHASSA